MPGGKGNINGNDGNTFSSTNQPKHYRKSTKFLTELLIKESKKKRDVVIEGIEMVNGIATGRKVKIKVPMPTKEVIVQAHLRECAKGRMDAIKEFYDRVEGKTIQPVQIGGDPGNPVTFAALEHLTEEELYKLGYGNDPKE